MDDRILESHVIKWMKCVEVLDASLDRFEDDEKKAYKAIRNIFGKNRPNMETLTINCETLEKYLDGGIKDKVYTAVRDFLKTTEIAKEDFQAFKELLQDNEFFGSTAGGSTGFEGSSEGTATYRRVEIDGDIYEGMFLGNDRVWKGKITYVESDLFYEGEWDNNGPHGEGVLTFNDDGTKYIGKFDGVTNGVGRIEWEDGDWYKGAWCDGGPEGIGEMMEGDTYYKGQFIDGARGGKGRIEWSNGNWYEGDWNNEGANGYGTWRMGNRLDKGEYRDGKRVGKGRMDWDDGDWYEGGWNDEGPHGYGVWKIGTRTDKGEYENGLRVGQGRMEWENGGWYEGGWNENGKHGKGRQYSSSHNRIDEGEWNNDDEVGTVKMKWGNNDTYVGTWNYKGGYLNGEGEYYTASTGKTRRGEWVSGNWHNSWATGRNIIGVILWILAGTSLLGGSILMAIIFGIVGKIVYEGK